LKEKRKTTTIIEGYEGRTKILKILIKKSKPNPSVEVILKMILLPFRGLPRQNNGNIENQRDPK
jgi:hypothetical protein